MPQWLWKLVRLVESHEDGIWCEIWTVICEGHDQIWKTWVPTKIWGETQWGLTLELRYFTWGLLDGYTDDPPCEIYGRLWTHGISHLKVNNEAPTATPGIHIQSSGKVDGKQCKWPLIRLQGVESQLVSSMRGFPMSWWPKKLRRVLLHSNFIPSPTIW